MPVTASAVIMGAIGAGQAISGSIKAKKLLRQRKAYSTPEEYRKILQATQAGMSDTRSLDYATTQMDRSFAGVLGSAERLGADPNQLSALLDQKVQGIIKVGEQNHLQNMSKFNQYLGALDMMGKNEEAEWASRENMIKDQQQAAAADKQAGLQNIGSAMNAGIGIYAANQTANLYKMQPKTLPDSMREAASPITPLTTIPSADSSISNTVLPNRNAGVVPTGLLNSDMYGNYKPMGSQQDMNSLLDEAARFFAKR